MSAAYELVVVGAGAAGLTAARFAARLGARVALVERDRPGGDCTWTGCVPSKALLKAARVASDMRHAGRHGTAPVQPQVDLGRVMARVRLASERVYRLETPEMLRCEGVHVISGAARFRDPHTLEVDGNLLCGERFMVCSGASPALPPVPGLAGTPHLTNERVFELQVSPPRLLVLGGGPTGVELAQAFARLGSRVTLLEQADRLLPVVDPEAGALLRAQLEEDGVDVRLGAPLERVEPCQGGVRAALGAGVLGPVFNGEVRLTIIVLTDRVLPEVGYATTARVDRCRMGAAGAAPAAAESGQAAPGRILNAILWKLATGAPWRDLPERYGPWQTVYTRFWRWTRAGVWDRLLAAVERRADAAGALDGELHFVDGTIVRAHQHAAGAKGGPPTGGARPEPGWLLDQGPSPRRRPRPAADGGADARAAARGHRP